MHTIELSYTKELTNAITQLEKSWDDLEPKFGHPQFQLAKTREDSTIVAAVQHQLEKASEIEYK